MPHSQRSSGALAAFARRRRSQRIGGVERHSATSGSPGGHTVGLTTLPRRYPPSRSTTRHTRHVSIASARSGAKSGVSSALTSRGREPAWVRCAGRPSRAALAVASTAPAHEAARHGRPGSAFQSPSFTSPVSMAFRRFADSRGTRSETRRRACRYHQLNGSSVRRLIGGKRSMEFAVGDVVVYGPHGAGPVAARETKIVRGERQLVIVIALADGLSVELPLSRAEELLRP